MVENETHVKIKCLRSDNGGKFNSNEFIAFCETHGIKRQFSAAKTTQQNGLLKGKKEHSKKLPKLCSMKQKCQIHFGEKLYTKLSTYLT